MKISNQIAFTSDLDWAPEEAIHEIVDIFNEFKVKCTFFATHKSSTLINCNKELFEIGIHPNYNPIFLGSKVDIEQPIDELLSVYKKAEGIRSHGFIQGSVFSKLYKSKGLKYESNILLPYSENIGLYTLWNGLISIPFNWEDDFHFYYKRSFKESGIDLNKTKLAILNFHPIHVFLNTNSQYQYEKAKKNYHNIDRLRKHINSKSEGTKTLLIKTLEFIKNNNYSTYKLSELVHSYLNFHGN